MPSVNTLEEARNFFLSNSSGSVICKAENGNSKVCKCYPEAVLFFDCPSKLQDFSRHGSGSKSFPQIKWQAGFALELNKMLWEAYVTLDHGDQDERLAMLDKLGAHFQKTGGVPKGD